MSKKPPLKQAGCGLPVLFSLVLLFSCKTSPQFPDPVLDGALSIPLEAGALAYVFADVRAARPILDRVPLRETDEKQKKQVLDMTRSFAAALYPPESGRRFQLTAWGKYPGGRAGMVLGMSRDWKKMRSIPEGFPYWYSSRNGISLAMGAKQAFVSASRNGSPEDPFTAPPGIEAPEGFAEFSRASALSLWVEEGGVLIGRFLEQLQIPLQIPAERIFAAIFPLEETSRYQVLIQMRFESPSQARALAAVFSLARGLLGGSPPASGGDVQSLGALLFANPPVQDGNKLNLKTAALGETEIALLFSLFSVY
jgi:hypothetical protein